MIDQLKCCSNQKRIFLLLILLFSCTLPENDEHMLRAIIRLVWRLCKTVRLVRHPKMLWGGSPSLVVMGDDSCLRGRGFESRCRFLDGHGIFSHGFVVKLYCLFEKTENKQMEAGVRPIFFKKVAQFFRHCSKSSFLVTLIFLPEPKTTSYFWACFC